MNDNINKYDLSLKNISLDNLRCSADKWSGILSDDIFAIFLYLYLEISKYDYVDFTTSCHIIESKFRFNLDTNGCNKKQITESCDLLETFIRSFRDKTRSYLLRSFEAIDSKLPVDVINNIYFIECLEFEFETNSGHYVTCDDGFIHINADLIVNLYKVQTQKSLDEILRFDISSAEVYEKYNWQDMIEDYFLKPRKIFNKEVKF